MQNEERKQEEHDIPEMNLNNKYSNRKDLIPETPDKMKKELDKTKKELEKCVMLCANCHRIRHANGMIGKEAVFPPKG